MLAAILLQFVFALTIIAAPISTANSDDNPVDVVSNSVSPLSANDAGNSNSNTGLLNGNSKRRRQSPTDVVSNSLSPLSDNVAGNNNQNTGTADGDSITIDPTIDPTL